MSTEWGGVYLRGKVYWIHYRVTGERFFETTGLKDGRAAHRLLEKRRREVRDGVWQRPESRTPEGVTVAVYLERWIEKRKADGVRCVADEARFLRRFALPAIGKMPMRDVERRHIVDLVAAIRRAKHTRTGEPLSPRTVLHAYRAIATAFKDASRDGVIVESPCKLSSRPGELPAKEDRDPDWRSAAVYTRDEAEAVISDERIPLERRVFYALMLCTGMRSNEAAGRRWRDLDSAAVPLGRLTIATQAASATSSRRTKTGKTKIAPVHPTLAGLLDHWKRSGFALVFGRHPQPDDPIVPSRRGVGRFRRKTFETLRDDLERIGVRCPPSPRHAMRATFLTLCEADGCNMDVIQRMTHAAPATVVGGYLRTGWPALCAELGKLTLGSRPVASVTRLHPGDSRAQKSTRPGKTRAAQAPGTGLEPLSQLGSPEDSRVTPGPVGAFQGPRIPRIHEVPGRAVTLSPADRAQRRALALAAAHFRALGQHEEAAALETLIATSDNRRAEG